MLFQSTLVYSSHITKYCSIKKVLGSKYLTEVESKTQSSRSRTQKNSEAKAKDRLSEDRSPRGQGQESSRPSPRTQRASVLKKQGLRAKKSQMFRENLGVLQKNNKEGLRTNKSQIFRKNSGVLQKQDSSSIFREVSGVLHDEKQKWS